MKRKYEIHTIATTSTDGFSYEEYVEWCEETGEKPTDDGFEDWKNDESRINWESDIENIECCKMYNVPVRLGGSLGLWDGRHEIRPVRFESVGQALKACIGRDTLDMEVIWVEGTIIVHADHHDGRNVYEICALNKKGQAKKSAAYKPHDIKRLPYLYDLGVK